MKKEKLTDDKMVEEVSSVIDELMSAIKISARKVFNLLVEKTAQTTSDAVDEKVEILKVKMKEKGKHEKDKDSGEQDA